MSDNEVDIVQCHLQVCAGFADGVAAAAGRWDRPSPCTGWDARAVLEHVIGFHDVLLLRPLGAKPDRPRDDPARRWALTVDALKDLFDRSGLFERVIDVPAVGNRAPTQIDARLLVPMLSQDVFIHTWDLARAADADDQLDPGLCSVFYGRLPADPETQVRSGMFKRAVEVSDDTDLPSRLLARLGRDPNWRTPDG